MLIPHYFTDKQRPQRQIISQNLPVLPSHTSSIPPFNFRKLKIMSDFSDKLQPFSVIFFPVEKKYSVVPSLWIVQGENGLVCSWPSSRTKDRIGIFKKPDAKPDSTFTPYPAEVIRSYSTYERALKKLKKTDPTAESSEGETLKLPTVTKPVPLPEPPATSFAQNNQIIRTATQSEGIISSRGTDDLTSSVHDASGGPSQPVTLAGDPILPEQQVTLVIPGFDELAREFRKFQEDCITKQEEILRDLSDLRHQVRILLSQKEESSTSTQVRQKYPPLPLKDQEEFKITEELITTDKVQFTQLVKELKRTGGPTVAKSVYNTLRALFRKELAQTLRLTASSGKIPFAETKIASAIKEAVRSLWDDISASDTIITKYIGNHLRGLGKKPQDANKSRKGKNNGDVKKNKEKANSESSSDEAAKNSGSEDEKFE